MFCLRKEVLDFRYHFSVKKLHATVNVLDVFIFSFSGVVLTVAINLYLEFNTNFRICI
jgi:hypothetical protein